MSSLKECNIILLGETGTGKSLFINSVANYLKFHNLSQAISDTNGTISLISSKFEVTDSNYDTHEISAGENDGNERTELAESFTIDCKSYTFKLADKIVRLIDTPGVGDTDGGQADHTNIENILKFMAQFDNLHAIVIFMKNTETKMTDRFSECLKLLLTNLNKTALENIVFVLTFSKANDFKPGPIKNVIEKFLKIELATDSKLTLNRTRMYCFDNKCYEYLMATQHGVKFDERDFVSQNLNWQYSSEETNRLFAYVSGLAPHKVRDSMSLNDARQFIKAVYPFLSEILENINNNKEILQQYQHEFQARNEDIQSTINDRNFKQIDLQIVHLDRAVTFCTSEKCREEINFGGITKYHYPNKCCVGCVTFDLWKSWCTAIGSDGKCKVCGCKQDEHQRRFYETMKVESNLLNEEAVVKIKSATDVKERLSLTIQEINEIEEQLEIEKHIIEDAEIKLVKFLQTYSLTKPPESSKAPGKSEFYSTECQVVAEYEKEVAEIQCISVEDVYIFKEILTNLSINGKKILDILEANKKETNLFYNVELEK